MLITSNCQEYIKDILYHDFMERIIYVDNEDASGFQIFDESYTMRELIGKLLKSKDVKFHNYHGTFKFTINNGLLTYRMYNIDDTVLILLTRVYNKFHRQ